MKLYETTIGELNIWDEMEDLMNDGETNPDVFAALEASLTELEDQKEKKAIAVACKIKDYLAEVNALKAEKQRIDARMKSANNTVDWLKGYLQGNLETGTPIKDAKVNITWRKSEKCIVDDIDLDTLPEEYVRVKKDVDKSALKDALKEGAVFAYARLEESQNIQIK